MRLTREAIRMLYAHKQLSPTRLLTADAEVVSGRSTIKTARSSRELDKKLFSAKFQSFIPSHLHS